MNPVILYDNILADATLAATDTATDYSVDNLKDYRVFTWWKAASSGTKYLTIDYGSAVAADALAFIGHNFGTASATVSLESSTTGAWTGEEVVRVAGFAPSDDYAILKLFTSATARYWRIKIVTSSIAAKLAVTFLGARMTFPVGCALDRFDDEGIEATVHKSKAGNLLGSTVRFHPVKVKATFQLFDYSWYAANIRPFWDDHGKLLKPFFWAFDPEVFTAKINYVLLPEKFKLRPKITVATRIDSLTLEFDGVAE